MFSWTELAFGTEALGSQNNLVLKTFLLSNNFYYFFYYYSIMGFQGLFPHLCAYVIAPFTKVVLDPLTDPELSPLPYFAHFSPPPSETTMVFGFC